MSDETKQLRDQLEAQRERTRLVEQELLRSTAHRLASEVSTDPELTAPMIRQDAEIMHVHGEVRIVRAGTGELLSDYVRSDVVTNKLGRFAKATSEDGKPKQTDDGEKKALDGPLDRSWSIDDQIAWVRAKNEKRKQRQAG